MGRSSLFGLVVSVALLIFLMAGLAGCGSSPVNSTNFPIPASITLFPAPNLSMEIGTNQSLTAGLLDAAGRPLVQPLSFQSSNTAAVTVAANGQACAGSWDSLNNPQICTPGQIGVAQITATAQGVSSPPTTVYVHQHIDKLVVESFLLPNQPPPANPCYSVGQFANYKATAYSRGADITSTVGVFNWQAIPTTVVNMSTTATGLLAGQVQATAKIPGLTSIFATIGNSTSVPTYFTACPVQSIALTVTASTTTSKTITPTILDSVGETITGIPLTWSSSEPTSAAVGTTGVATATATGGASTIIASCTPPACNIGIYPSLPIYPQNVVTMTLASTTSRSNTVYVSSTGCGTTDGCFSTAVPITTPANTLGTFINLPATPNTLLFDRKGSRAYLGTNSGLLGSAGLAVLDATSNTVALFTALPGKVLAISPDGLKVIISDTAPADGPNRVFVFDTTSKSSVTFQITGATAADFSPDSLKAYIVAGSTLYVYSKLDALRAIPLAAPVTDVSLLSEGAFAYLAGGDPAGVTVRRTCDNKIAEDSSGTPQIIPTPAVPTFIKTLADAGHVLAVDSPGIDIISVSAINASGCAPTVSNSASSFNLGQGSFVAKQLIVSQDGSTAYVVTSNPGSILVYSIAGQTSAAISLAGNATPLSASLTADGKLLYVGGSDGYLHVVDIVIGADVQQISFAPTSLCQNSAGQPAPVTCNPDLVVVKP
jgi:trimeric autotransporter adhesin